MTHCNIILALIVSNFFFCKVEAILEVSYYLARSPTLIDDIITYDRWFCLLGCGYL